MKFGAFFLNLACDMRQFCGRILPKTCGQSIKKKFLPWVFGGDRPDLYTLNKKLTYSLRAFCLCKQAHYSTSRQVFGICVTKVPLPQEHVTVLMQYSTRELYTIHKVYIEIALPSGSESSVNQIFSVASGVHFSSGLEGQWSPCTGGSFIAILNGICDDCDEKYYFDFFCKRTSSCHRTV